MRSFAIAGMLLLCSGAALAADLPLAVKAPVTYAPYSWTGLYIGAQAGYGWVDTDSNVVQTVPPSPYILRSSGSPDGAFGGGFIGYNYQLSNNVVVGIEADINGGNLKSSDPVTINAPVIPVVTARSELEWFGSVRARLGYAFDRLLPYATAGYAFGSAKTTYASPFPGDSISASDTLSGWTVGAGLEYAITDNILARIEYRYTDYGSSSSAVSNAFAAGTLEQAFTSNDLRIGISYKF